MGDLAHSKELLFLLEVNVNSVSRAVCQKIIDEEKNQTKERGREKNHSKMLLFMDIYLSASSVKYLGHRTTEFQN